MKTFALSIVALLVASTTLSAQPNQRPNILFIMTDQQFGDVMSCRMGKQFIHTPAMDGLASSGMVFTRAYVANPLCMPSRQSIFTGRYPHETGVTRNSRDENSTFLPCMGTYFANAGYETAYFGKWHLSFKSQKASQHGFEATAQLKRTRHWDAQISDSAREFLSREHDKPFLAVVSFHNPHDVCEYARGEELPGGPIGEPPPLDQCPPVPANLAAPQGETDSMGLLRRAYHADRRFPVGDFSIAQWRRQRWGYYRLVEKVDTEIGLVLEALSKGDHKDDTVIVFTSDHGECAGAHRFNQKTVFYDESTRVPLIVSLTGETKTGVSDLLVNTGVDIIPTLCDFAGIPVPEQLPGRSLRLIATGGTLAPWRDHIVVQNDMSQAGTIDGLRPRVQGRMVRTDRYKYCVYEYGLRRESLIDMQNDPLETRNLVTLADHREALLRHRRLLATFGERHQDKLAPTLLANDVGPRPFQPNEKRRSN